MINLYDPDAFDVAWNALAVHGFVDGLGGSQYRRIRNLWDTTKACGRVDPTLWIQITVIWEELGRHVAEQEKRFP